jgi:lysozyme
MSRLIKKHEGFSSSPYLCPKGVWTIGYGITVYPDGRKVSQNDEPITEIYAEALLNDYLIREVYPVFSKIPLRLTENQKDALASLIYNWNAKGFLNSKLYKAICKKDWANVCREWDYGFKNNLDGLFKRRTEELCLFMQDI